MNVHIRLFAVARQLAGQDSVSLELPDGATVAQLRQRLAADVPALSAVLPQVLFAVGTGYAQDATVIKAGDEIACIPPVSGG